MNETEINGWRQVLEMKTKAHSNTTFDSAESLEQSLEGIREAKKTLADFILPKVDEHGRIDINGWREAHNAITGVWGSTESTKVEVLLPTFSSTQAKRRRIESREFLMFRPVFRQYEEEIFGTDTNDDGVKGLFGLYGPQGFGKSVFLHCLALKRAFDDNLVVWVPSSPPSLDNFQKAVATAFYRGSQAGGLSGIPYMKKSDKVIASLEEIQEFAERNELLLLIVVDQLHHRLDYFEELKKTLEDYSLSFEGKGHRVLMSSSTSGTATPVFSTACFDLNVFDHFLSPVEITLLKNHFQTSPNMDLVQGGEWSFLQAASILSGPATNLEQIASEFTTKLENQFRFDNNEVSMLRKVEYMRVLHMVVAREESPSYISFDSNMVDGDLFFVKRRGNGVHVICEFLQGFANLVLQNIKGKRDYEEYLRFVIGSDHFNSITRGAQGSILEDAVSYLLRNKTHPIKFALTGLDGKTGLHRMASFQLNSNRHVQRFTTVSGLGKLSDWRTDDEWFVGIPPEGFTGIDFVLARTRVVGQMKTKTLEIFFIQSTVSTPQDHGVKKSQEQEQLIALFRKKAGVTNRHTNLYVTFLTPKLGTGAVNENMEYGAKHYYHSSFQKLEGNDPLARIISGRCKSVWGN